MDDHHREFDLENRERLIRMEENQKATRSDLTAHIGREEREQERWRSLFEKLFDQHRELKDEMVKLREELNDRIDEIHNEQAQRKGAEKVLLWVGGTMFTAGSGVLAWVVNHWPKGG